MLNKTQMLEIPEYAPYNLQKIAETGKGGLNLKKVGRLLIDREEK